MNFKTNKKMENVFNEFMLMSIPQKGLFLFWCVCVMSFYSSLMVIVTNAFYDSIKKIYKKSLVVSKN